MKSDDTYKLGFKGGRATILPSAKALRLKPREVRAILHGESEVKIAQIQTPIANSTTTSVPAPIRVETKSGE